MSSFVIDCETGEGQHVPLDQEQQDALDQAQQDAAAGLQAEQWATVASVRGAQLTQTDWLVEPWPADTPDAVTAEIKANEQGWADFRQALRDIDVHGSGDPTALVWPTPPSSPTITITPPPDFVDSTGWPPEHVPAP